MTRSPRTEFDQFHLDGAWNFRDTGGLRAPDGATVRPGRLFRSSALTHLTDAGRFAMTELGITVVVDLRGEAEVSRIGTDRAPESVTVRAHPYVLSENAPHERTERTRPTSGREYLDGAYRTFATLPGARTAIRSVIDTVVAGSPVLVHCAAGKDRAGWTVATVLRAAGVTDEDIVADYLRSNDAVAPLRRHIVEHANASPAEMDGLDDDLLGVREEYYRAGLDAMTDAHGSFDGYLDWLGVDIDTRVALRRALLTHSPE